MILLINPHVYRSSDRWVIKCSKICVHFVLLLPPGGNSKTLPFRRPVLSGGKPHRRSVLRFSAQAKVCQSIKC